jgi:hypothetical protein
VLAGSDKENAKATYRGGTGFCPNLATCDNTDDMLAIDPRPGNSTSNCAHDNIALLDLAVSRLPGPFRHNVLVRPDGAGFSHELLEHIAAGGGRRGRHWEFSVGWSCTDVEIDAIARLPKAAWTPGTDQNGDVLDDTGPPDVRAAKTVAPPARGLALDHRPDRCLARGASTARTNLAPPPPTRRAGKDPGRSVEPGAPGATAGPQPCPQNGNLDQKTGLVVTGPTPPPS